MLGRLVNTCAFSSFQAPILNKPSFCNVNVPTNYSNIFCNSKSYGLRYYSSKEVDIAHKLSTTGMLVKDILDLSEENMSKLVDSILQNDDNLFPYIATYRYKEYSRDKTVEMYNKLRASGQVLVKIPDDVQKQIDNYAKEHHTSINTVDDLVLHLQINEHNAFGADIVNAVLLKHVCTQLNFGTANFLEAISSNLEWVGKKLYGPYTKNPGESIAAVKKQITDIFEGNADLDDYRILNDRQIMARCVFEHTMNNYGTDPKLIKEIISKADLSLGHISIDMLGPTPIPFHTHVEPPIIKPYYEREEDDHDD